MTKSSITVLMLISSSLMTAVAQTNSPTANLQIAGERYRDEIFQSVAVDPDIPYSQAPNLQTGQNEIILLDLYQPKGDTAPLRPAIIWIHGGGFRGLKDRKHEFYVTLSNRFAKRGYVTTSIDYREYGQGVPEATIPAAEDAKAAIRWLRANAAAYRIDPTRICIGGKSAGAFTSLYATYSDSIFSGIVVNNSNPGHSTEVSACIEMAGGLIDMQAMGPGEPPLNIIHGTADASIPFLAALLLESRAQEVGVPYELHAIPGAGHDLSPHMDDIVQWSGEFLYKYVINGLQTGVTERKTELPRSLQLAQNYPNPVSLSKAAASGNALSTTIRYAISEAGEAKLRVFNALGQEMQILANGWHEPGNYSREFAAKGLPAGLYFYRLQTGNTVMTRKMILTK